jgi:hypothetical protein
LNLYDEIEFNLAVPGIALWHQQTLLNCFQSTPAGIPNVLQELASSLDSLRNNNFTFIDIN